MNTLKVFGDMENRSKGYKNAETLYLAAKKMDRLRELDDYYLIVTALTIVAIILMLL